MVSFLNREELNAILEEKTGPVLIACLDRGSGFNAQKAVLDGIRHIFGKALSVYLLDAEHIDFIDNRFGIRGAPTYILFQKGERKDRIMGRIDKEDISAFVSETLGIDANAVPARNSTSVLQ